MRYFLCCTNTPADHVTVAVQQLAYAGTLSAEVPLPHTGCWLTFGEKSEFARLTLFPRYRPVQPSQAGDPCYTEFKLHLSQMSVSRLWTGVWGWLTLPVWCSWGCVRKLWTVSGNGILQPTSGNGKLPTASRKRHLIYPFKKSQLKRGNNSYITLIKHFKLNQSAKNILRRDLCSARDVRSNSAKNVTFEETVVSNPRQVYFQSGFKMPLDTNLQF